MGRRRALAALSLVIVLVAGFDMAAQAATSEGADASAADAAAAGPSDIAIPYADTASIEPQAPWRIADCDAIRALSPLVRECDAETVLLASESYDPDAGVTVLPIALTTGPRTMTVQYRVSLESPPAPAATPVTGRAVAAGALLRIPLSDFALDCTVCVDGGSTAVAEIDPVEAGSAWTTPTHVVFRASREFRGSADIHVIVADDYGTETRTGATVSVYPAVDELHALDVAVAVGADGRADVDLSALAGTTSDSEIMVVGCGAAVHGSVVCLDGVAQYSGPVDAGADQFGFHVIAGGEQAFGSVVIVAEGEPTGIVSATRIDGEEPVPMLVRPPAPPEGGGQATQGLFRPISAVLDRVGAR